MTMIRRLFLAALALLVAGSPALAAPSDSSAFVIAGHSIASGTRADLRIAVPDSVAGVPPRARRIVVSHYHLVHSTGAGSKIPAGQDIQIVRTGAGT